MASVDTDDNNLYIDDGLDGFPSFGFRPGSEVKQPYRLYLPEKLPAEFTLVATFKPMSFRTSYLFAVLNPFETVVQLGIRISVSVTLRVINFFKNNHFCGSIFQCVIFDWVDKIKRSLFQLYKYVKIYNYDLIIWSIEIFKYRVW